MNDIKVFDQLLLKYHENKLAHAFLLETNDFERCYNDIYLFIKKIICPFDYIDNCANVDCNLCNLVDNHSLPSIIEIEPEGQFIKKNQVLSMMERFSSKPVFSKYNIYIVKNAEKLNSSSANSLLKFLEEPSDDIFGIFVTNNRENVISTVKSRCQIFGVYYDTNEQESLDEDVLLDVKLYLNSIYNNKEDLLYNKTHMVNLYSERSQWEIFFKTMLYYVKSCLETDRKDKIEMIKKISKENLINIMILIENSLKYINSNVNIDLILDKFVIEMRNYYE